MAGLSLSGLASGFDWKSVVEQLMTVEHAPADRLSREQTKNSQQNTAITGLTTKLDALQTAADALKSVTIFSGRKAKSGTTDSTWSTSAAAGSAPGSYRIAVSQLATSSRLTGTANIGKGLNTVDDNVSGLTLSTLATGAAPTAGTFTINGKKVTVALTDSLQNVFDAISTATGGDVTASYNHSTDKITLTSASNATLVLGAANDTSNLLRVLKLGNNGSDTVTSSGALGAVKTTAKLTSAGLTSAITAVDGSGNGSFSINGVSISYNVNDDTLAGVIKRINSSGAGVTAGYDAINDRMSLVNNLTGDLGIAVSESSGGLLAALGVTTGTLARGDNAEFSVDGGPTLTSNGNTLDEAAHGIAGLTVTADSETTQTVTVSADTDAMRSKIDAFVSAFNAVQTYVDEKSKITSANGKVTAAVLAGNRDVQGWADQLRSTAFAAVSGVSGTIQRLEHMGIDFDGTTGHLEVSDEDKLTAALADHPGDVEDFFQTSSTGFVAKFSTLLERFTTSNDDQVERLTKSNSSLDDQIADIERRIEQQRELLTNSFIAMETAQAKIQQQSTALTNAFSSSSK